MLAFLKWWLADLLILTNVTVLKRYLINPIPLEIGLHLIKIKIKILIICLCKLLNVNKENLWH